METNIDEQFPEREPVRIDTLVRTIELASKFVQVCDIVLAAATSESDRADILETKQALEKRLRELKLEWNDQLEEEFPATN